MFLNNHIHKRIDMHCSRGIRKMQWEIAYREASKKASQTGSLFSGNLKMSKTLKDSEVEG